MKTLYTVEEVTALIASNKPLMLAGSEELLKLLPSGNWIGGTIPYFMSAEKGGVHDTEHLFVTQFPDSVTECSVVNYNEKSLNSIAADEYENGFTMLIVPGFSNIHLSFAKNASNIPNIFDHPLLGWISGVSLDKIGVVSPKTVNGKTGMLYENEAAALHCKVEDGKSAVVDIINLFEQDDNDVITFEKTDFQATDCLVNGKKTNLSDYLQEKQIDLKLPLVADYYGAMINTSFQAVDEETKTVKFYAPVFPDVEYKIAKPVQNYVQQFAEAVSKDPITPVFTCNCILNYLYGELEGKHTSGVTGPITFGEIAYQLLNQTFVHLTIK